MSVASMSPIAAVDALPNLGATGTANLQLAGSLPGAFATPSAHDAAEFNKAALQNGPLNMQAALPPSTEGIGSGLAHQMEQLTRHLGSLQGQSGPHMMAQPGDGPAMQSRPGAAMPNATGFDRADMNGAVAQIEHAYMFAIETTMASRGSTESTKIFNTLLKGQ